MKKAITLFLFAGMFAFVACGPSAKEKEAQEKAKQDSINAAREAFVADSIALVERVAFVADSIAKREQFVKDSLAEASKKTTKPATKPEPKPQPTVKPGQGKRS